MSAVKPLVAYSVQADECGCVRFARSGAQARREGASEMDTDWEGIETCRRAPQFDHYSPGPVPEKALFEAGWRFLCETCEARAITEWSEKHPICDDCRLAAQAAAEQPGTQRSGVNTK